MRKTLLAHFAKYPYMTLIDAIKLIHQSEFAGGHLIRDENSAFQYLKDEIDSLDILCENGTLIESIDDETTMIRIHLRPFKAKGLDFHRLHQAFCESANKNTGSKAEFKKKISDLKLLIDNNELPLSIYEFNHFMLNNDLDSMPLFRHSTLYKELYMPHYRVVEKALFDKYCLL